MATKNKGGKGKQISLGLGLKDERIPKLFGILMVFLSIYLLIAFISYLFTWQIDQDNVLQHSWEYLFKGEESATNWLGRLGAIVSNIFIFWGFGLSSFIFVGIFAVLGVALIKRAPLARFVTPIWRSFLFLLFSAVFLEFLFLKSDFPWGGAFGESVCTWLHNFVGTAGMIALFLFLIIGFVTWVFNPNYNELSRDSMQVGFGQFFKDLFSGRIFMTAPTASGTKAKVTGLKPKRAKAALTDVAGPRLEGEIPQAPPNPELVAEEEENKEGQLKIPLKDKKDRKKPQALRSGDDALEIADAPKPDEADLLPEEPPKPKPAPAPDLVTNEMVIAKNNIQHTEPYDPTLELSSYEHPVLALLEDYSDGKVEIDRAELEANKDQIIETLLNYKIEIIKIKATIGPTVTLYEIVPAPGVRISKIKNLEDDIALSLSALGIRIIAPIPGKGTIGIEVPNTKQQIVALKEILVSDKFKRAKMDLPIAFGKTISNEVFVADLAKMPHLLIAGATGQGKSVGINVILMSLLYKKHPSQIKFVLIDPKKVELFPYSALENHFLAYLPGLDEPIVTDITKVVHTLNSLIIEMETRYNLLKKAQARNIKEYNEKFVSRRLNPQNGHDFMPFIVLVIDEFADLIMTAGKEVEVPLGRLAQLSRAVGIHIVIATQRPSVNIITGVIKANFPARIAYKVTAKVDSRTIIDTGGADRLVGRGDMLLSYGSNLVRLQCAFLDTPEVERVIDYIAKQQGYPIPFFLPEFHGDDDDHGKSGVKVSELDDNFEKAARLVVSNQHGSTSMIQRRLKLGYNRAGRIMDQMESLGIVGPSAGSKPREVLVFSEAELERYLEDIKTRK